MCGYNDSNEAINIGSGKEVSIKELAEKIAKVLEFSGEIKWDLTKPDGQYRKRLDLTKLYNQAWFDKNMKFTELDSGIRETGKWYQEHQLVGEV